MSKSRVVTRKEYEALVDRLEDLEDALFLSHAAATKSDREYLPVAMVERMIAGDNRVRLWREHRGMTAKALAAASGIDPAYLSQIETGKKPGSIKAIRALANALRVRIDDLTAD